MTPDVVGLPGRHPSPAQRGPDGWMYGWKEGWMDRWL